jgi:hypothetical protein
MAERVGLLSGHLLVKRLQTRAFLASGSDEKHSRGFRISHLRRPFLSTPFRAFWYGWHECYQYLQT